MHPAMKGFLIGLAVALLLIAIEYFMVKKAVEERALARHKKPEFEPTDKRRIRTLVNFCLFLPVGFALAFWLLD
ncbi:MAG TPA: hypothetical protein VJ690_01610 [Burkholderiales bacterium]|jgi:hypothetical protein|nr:hypothetical protein [Burkholderiales bacterium]